MDSIRATSTGNTEEDAAIERAIRVSVAELRRRPPGQDESEQSAIERAIKASIAEHSKGRDLDGGAKHDEHLEAAIQSSMRDNERGRGYNPDDSDIGTDDDENVKRAIEESKAHAQGHGGDGLEDDPELQRALKESEKHQQSRESENNRAKREEEIVLEYIKKQSLLEEEHRGRMG